jgi:peptidoglycan/LPS O-acetylase OafA/YrhL
MSGTQQPQPAGTGPTSAGAAAELAEIQRRQEQVIKTALVPAWYWWVIGAAIVAIGAARDSHKTVVLAITIPLAVLVIAGVIGATIPEVRRRVKVNSATQPGARGAVAIFGLIVLVNAVIIVAASSLDASHAPHPMTIGYAAGAAVLVTGGPLLNRYLGMLMMSNARQHLADPPAPRSTWSGLLSGDPGGHSAGHGAGSGGGATP